MPGIQDVVKPPSLQLQRQYKQIEQEVDAYENRRQNGISADDLEKELLPDVNTYPVIYPGKYALTRNYWDALFKLEAMAQVDSLSLVHGIYLVENAYLDGKLPFDKFQKLIDNKVELCRYIMKRDKLPDTDLAKQYAIQKLFSDKISRYDPRTKTTKVISPFSYDFNDYMGREHWENMFVSKLLISGKGQCHSMPLLYLIMAEQLGTRAYLSYAPEHSYIQFYDPKGTAYHFETTSGLLVSQNWLMQSGFINATAIKHNTYLDTLDRQQLTALLIMDLTLGYLQKYGYDGFVEQGLKSVQSLSPDNLQALMVQANIATARAMQAIRAAGSPPPDKLKDYPEAYNLYTQMQQYYKRIDNLGYQRMPPEAYQRWLASVKEAARKQESEAISKRFNEVLKPKVTINVKPK